MTPTTDSFDVAIVGGGLVGASMACALEPLGYSVVMIEQVEPRGDAPPSYDDRTLALSYSSCQILDALGLWDSLRGVATPMQEIIVTELNRPGRVSMHAAEMGVESFGHVVEAREFGKAVLERLRKLEHVDVRCPVSVIGLEAADDSSQLMLSGPQGESSVHARLVIAADGAGSAVRQLLNIETQTRDYEQVAVICNVTPEHHAAGRAFEKLTPSGPFALLPHAGDRCGLVWSMPACEADEKLSLSDEDFMRQAQQRFGSELGRFLKIGKRSGYPLKLVRALKDTAHRTIIMGNAAHAIHPIGAQGFNLGLRDVAVLAELLSDPRVVDPGSSELLATYSKWRRPDQNETVSWTDGLSRLFANPSPLAAALRSSGMLLHALVPSMRKRLASKAMGYRGRTPKMALGQKLSTNRRKLRTENV